jgi:autotransporter strand-loop-strand O-heptosyltransferase
MRIAQINLGTIEIPPKSWGAIEKVIWNYKLELEKLGHQVDIVFPWELYDNAGDLKYDIVHFHAANQAIEAWNDKNIPYVFSIHDHHVMRYGKGSVLYFNNLIAMKKSVASITYAEILVDYFDTTDKLFYIPHGADPNIYINKNVNHNKHKLLCVANNGYADDNSYDRKGFRYSIEAAKKLDLEITIVGPDNNNNFFDKNRDLYYNKLKFIKNPTEKELVDIYNDHTIFLHPSELEAGHPNLTLVEALSCGLPIVGTYSGKEELKGLVKCDRNTSDVVNKIKEVINNYDKYKADTKISAEKYSWKNVVATLNDFYNFTVSVKNNFTRQDMRNHVIKSYNESEIRGIPNSDPKMNYNVHFNGRDGKAGPFFEMLCVEDKNIHVDFIDITNNVENIVYSLDMKSNTWAMPNITYYRKWRIKVSGDDNRQFDFDLNNKNVLISFHSSSIGDSLAWIPYVEEFRKKHNCIMYCSTFHNYLYENEYKDVIFIKPGEKPNELYATYNIGWFSPPWGGARNEHPNDYRTIPLQQTISDILGLEYKEIVPKITIPEESRPIKDKYVVIAEHSTANAKHWHYKNGWQTIVNWLNNLGYKVMVISKQGTTLRNIINETGDRSLLTRINQIKHSEFMITIGSGLAWLAWATGKKVVMISGFSDPLCEFKSNCVRVINKSVCNGCFNDIRYEFDRGDWNWCPAFKNTPKQFECTKTITPDMVIDKIEKEIFPFMNN